MSKPRTKTHIIWCTPEQHANAGALAKSHGMNRAEFLRRILRLGYAEYQRRGRRFEDLA